MARTVEINVFKFEELPEKVQNKLIDQNRYNDFDYDWSLDHIDYFKERVATSGLQIDEVAARINHSQGDGCAIVANPVDFKEIDIDKLMAVLAEYDQEFDRESLEQLKFWGVSCHFSNDSNHYAHNSYAHDLESESLFNVQDEVSYNGQVFQFTMSLYNQLENTLVELAKTLSHIIYKVLSDESIYLLSDEYIKEQLVEIDDEYTINGQTV